jgi:hypothetical protein
MSKYINTEDLHKVVLKRKAEYGSFADLIDNIVEEMVKETPYADVVEKNRYDVLQSENKVLWRQLHQSCNRVYELDKLNGNMRDKIDKSIAEMREEYDNFTYSANKTLGASFGIRKAIEILEKNLGEEYE